MEMHDVLEDIVVILRKSRDEFLKPIYYKSHYIPNRIINHVHEASNEIKY